MNRDIQRLKNTELFYELRSDTHEENGNQHIKLHLKNKFSLIPIFKYKQGGGTSLLTVGAYEVNFLNRLLEVGTQYEKMNGKSGFVSWFRHPYFLSRKNSLGTEIYVHTINLPLFTPEGIEEAFFDNEETRWNIRFLRELSENIRVGSWISLYKNNFSFNNSTVDKTTKNSLFAQDHPLNSGLTVSMTPRMIIGGLNKEKFYVQGSEITLQGEFAQRSMGSDFDFAKGEIHWLSGFRPREKINIVSQFQLGSKTGSEFQHKFYLGGLDTVRGFLDGQFRGDHFWVANLELRPTLLENPLWVLQGNLFTDWAKTWDGTHFSSEGFRRPFITYGTGFRIILPRIYRAVLRVDLAWTYEPVKQSGFSFGLQQFF